ncbi:MAG TPA: hypothetical protein VES20_07870 [Bryobacteraceae bacterium]|nr:hypothetical protein [Bryobacteraceae bacterium]
MTNRSLLALAAVVGCLAAEEHSGAERMRRVRRIHVEKLSGEASGPIRDMIINALQATRVFIVTENADKADAFLRGTAEDLIYTDMFQQSESVSARVGTSRSTRDVIPGMNAGVGHQESTRIAERKHEATAAIRLVDRDGEILWSTTQESHGAKFRGASADVADKVVRQLVTDLQPAKP